MKGEAWTDSRGRRFLVGLTVDREKLVNRLWRRAEKSKVGRATAINGAIVLQIKLIEDATPSDPEMV